MAFEAFLTQDRARPRKGRRVTYAVSLIAHAALVAVGIAYSFWHVDELSPPTVRITFMSSMAPAAPPPPPPPPPAAGTAPKKKVVTKPKILPTQIVQPRLTPPVEPVKKEEPDEDEPGATAGGIKGGVIGGTIGGAVGGVIGGAVGGTAAAPPAPTGPKMLPPHMGQLLKIAGGDPDFPAVLARAGMVYVVQAKICVGRAGEVESVTILKGADALLDRNVASKVKTWRYRPLMANNMAVPFCYFGRFEFKSE